VSLHVANYEITYGGSGSFVATAETGLIGWKKAQVINIRDMQSRIQIRPGSNRDVIF